VIDDTKVIYVAKSEKNHYQIEERKEICQKCRDEIAEIEEIAKNLKVYFGEPGYGGRALPDVKKYPGDPVSFMFRIDEYHGSRPEKDYIALWKRLGGPGADPSRIPTIRRLSTTGVLAFTEVLPTDSPYYQSLGCMHVVGSLGFNEGFALRKDLTPGQDIYFNGYLVIKGHKIPVGTLTIHIMYR